MCPVVIASNAVYIFGANTTETESGRSRPNSASFLNENCGNIQRLEGDLVAGDRGRVGVTLDVKAPLTVPNHPGAGNMSASESLPPHKVPLPNHHPELRLLFTYRFSAEVGRRPVSVMLSALLSAFKAGTNRAERSTVVALPMPGTTSSIKGKKATVKA